MKKICTQIFEDIRNRYCQLETSNENNNKKYENLCLTLRQSLQNIHT